MKDASECYDGGYLRALMKHINGNYRSEFSILPPSQKNGSCFVDVSYNDFLSKNVVMEDRLYISDDGKTCSQNETWKITKEAWDDGDYEYRKFWYNIEKLSGT